MLVIILFNNITYYFLSRKLVNLQAFSGCKIEFRSKLYSLLAVLEYELISCI